MNRLRISYYIMVVQLEMHTHTHTEVQQLISPYTLHGETSEGILYKKILNT